jgi:hypothetical protein
VAPSKVLVSDGRLVARVGAARAEPTRLAELGGRVLGAHGEAAIEAASTSARLASYRLADLNGRVLWTADGAPAPCATRAGAEGGALPTVGERGGETHARVEACAGVRRLDAAESSVREAAHWAAARAVQPTVRVSADAARAPEPGGARGLLAPMARVAAAPRREGVAWAR